MRNISDEKNSDYITWQTTFETKSRAVGPYELKSVFKSSSRTLVVIGDRVLCNNS